MSDGLTRGEDFLARCTASGARNPLLEEIHERSAEVLLSVYRLVKISLVHALSNDAVSRTLETSHAILTSFSASIGRRAAITYAHDTVFVCGELLRASRGVYDSARELGSLLGRCGVSEVSFAPELEPSDLFAFTEAASTAIREGGKRRLLLAAQIPNVTVRPVDALLARRQDDRGLELRERVLRTYASSLLVVRQFYDGVATGAKMLPHRVKRVAQRLVVLAEESDSLLLGATTLAHAQRDDAVRAVHAAILALVMARRLTGDRLLLARLVLSALVADAGRAQVLGPEGRDRLVVPSDEAESAVPAHAAAVAFVTGGVSTVTAQRAVTAFEVTWLEREELLGPPYGGGLDPLDAATLLRLARRMVDLVAPRDIAMALSPFEALGRLAGEPWVDATLLRVATSALGFYPVGTVLELESGEWGVVVGPSQAPGAASLPRLRLVVDSRGRAHEAEAFVDLGGPAGRGHGVARALRPDEARFNVTRAFVA